MNDHTQRMNDTASDDVNFAALEDARVSDTLVWFNLFCWMVWFWSNTCAHQTSKKFYLLLFFILGLQLILCECFFFFIHFLQSKRQEDMQKGRVEDAIRRHKQVQPIVPSICYCVTFLMWSIASNSVVVCTLLVILTGLHVFFSSYIEFIFVSFSLSRMPWRTWASSANRKKKTCWTTFSLLPWWSTRPKSSLVRVCCVFVCFCMFLCVLCRCIGYFGTCVAFLHFHIFAQRIASQLFLHFEIFLTLFFFFQKCSGGGAQETRRQRISQTLPGSAVQRKSGKSRSQGRGEGPSFCGGKVSILFVFISLCLVLCPKNLAKYTQCISFV